MFGLLCDLTNGIIPCKSFKAVDLLPQPASSKPQYEAEGFIGFAPSQGCLGTDTALTTRIYAPLADGQVVDRSSSPSVAVVLCLTKHFRRRKVHFVFGSRSRPMQDIIRAYIRSLASRRVSGEI